MILTFVQERRDPRFSALSGEFSQEAFGSAYSFIPELQQSEVASLKLALKAARKAAANSSKVTKEAREEEVRKLQKALKRTESMVEKSRRDVRERETISEVKKQEKKKQEDGKKPWYMSEGKLAP